MGVSATSGESNKESDAYEHTLSLQSMTYVKWFKHNNVMNNVNYTINTKI